MIVVSILFGKEDKEPLAREFATQEEVDAYLLGIDDLDGWLAYEVVEIKSLQ